MSDFSPEDEIMSEARRFAASMASTLRRYGQAATWLEKRRIRKEITQAWRAEMRQAELDRANQLKWTGQSVDKYRAHALAVAQRAESPNVDHERRYRDAQALARHRNDMAQQVLRNPRLTEVERGIALDGIDAATAFPEYEPGKLFARAHRVKGREALRYRAQVARARETVGIARPGVETEPIRYTATLASQAGGSDKWLEQPTRRFVTAAGTLEWLRGKVADTHWHKDTRVHVQAWDLDDATEPFYSDEGSPDTVRGYLAAEAAALRERGRDDLVDTQVLDPWRKTARRERAAELAREDLSAPGARVAEEDLVWGQDVEQSLTRAYEQDLFRKEQADRALAARRVRDADPSAVWQQPMTEPRYRAVSALREAQRQWGREAAEAGADRQAELAEACRVAGEDLRKTGMSWAEVRWATDHPGEIGTHLAAYERDQAARESEPDPYSATISYLPEHGDHMVHESSVHASESDAAEWAQARLGVIRPAAGTSVHVTAAQHDGEGHADPVYRAEGARTVLAQELGEWRQAAERGEETERQMSARATDHTSGTSPRDPSTAAAEELAWLKTRHQLSLQHADALNERNAQLVRQLTAVTAERDQLRETASDLTDRAARDNAQRETKPPGWAEDFAAALAEDELDVRDGIENRTVLHAEQGADAPPADLVQRLTAERDRLRGERDEAVRKLAERTPVDRRFGSAQRQAQQAARVAFGGTREHEAALAAIDKDKAQRAAEREDWIYEEEDAADLAVMVHHRSDAEVSAADEKARAAKARAPIPGHAFAGLVNGRDGHEHGQEMER